MAAALLGGSVLATATPGVAAAPAKCPTPTLSKQVKQADVVFRGMVDKARPVKGKGTQRFRTYKVKADRVYQGSLVTDAVVVTAAVGTKCPPPKLRQGKRYIFFVTEQGSRLISTRATAKATTQLTRKVVAKLGDGVQPQPDAPVHPTFTKVAGASPPSLSKVLAPGAALLIVSLLGLLVVGRLGKHASRI